MLVLAALTAALGAGVGTILQMSLLRTGGFTITVANYRGVNVPAAGGVVLAGTLLLVEGPFAVAALANPAASSSGAAAIGRSFLSADHAGFLITVLGFFLLGTIDDASSGGSKGLRGHLRSLSEGRLTTGILKMAGGVAVGLVAGALWELRLLPALVDALLIALSANLLNLLDLRPGRAVKVFLPGWLVIAGLSLSSPYVAISATIAGAAAIWLWADLRERGMLGDAGSNLLGSVLGAGMALGLFDSAKIVAIGVLLILTISSEVWSFNAFIERVPPLRWLDGLGRRMYEREPNRS